MIKQEQICIPPSSTNEKKSLYVKNWLWAGRPGFDSLQEHKTLFSHTWPDRLQTKSNTERVPTYRVKQWVKGTILLNVVGGVRNASYIFKGIIRGNVSFTLWMCTLLERVLFS
jgi:hypothetical protein